MPTARAYVAMRRIAWQGVVDGNRDLGWPEQAECVHFPNAFARECDRLLEIMGQEREGTTLTVLDDAVSKVIDTVNAADDAGFRHDQVAAQWPCLAAALAELMDVSGRKPPASWRLARREIEGDA